MPLIPNTISTNIPNTNSIADYCLYVKDQPREVNFCNMWIYYTLYNQDQIHHKHVSLAVLLHTIYSIIMSHLFRLSLKKGAYVQLAVLTFQLLATARYGSSEGRYYRTE